MTEIKDIIKETYEKAQKGHNNKAKLVAALKSKYNELEDKTIFHEEFVHYLKYPMIVYKREPAVENVIDFVAKFATSFEEPVENEEVLEESEEEENPFLNYLFTFLLKSHDANSHAVRFRVCQLINKLLGSMAENAQIDEDLFDRIHESMLIRVKDKFPNVRIQAALAMTRLQEPQNENCPTINAYMLLLENDSNPEVRRAALSCIAPCAKTLPKIVKRTRDVKESVRKLAYQVLAEKVHVRALSIAQRVKLLEQGLNDRSEAVREVVQKKLLQAWLRLSQGNVLELLYRLDVENCPEAAVAALNAMFSLSSVDDLLKDCENLDSRKLISAENLTCENTLYWRALCEYVKSKGDEGEHVLEQLLPEAAIYAQYLYVYIKSIPVLDEKQKSDFSEVENLMKKEFIAQQLIHLVGCVDTAEEGGRKRVLAVLQEMLVLPNTPNSLVSLLVEKLVTVLKDDDKRIQVIAEIISDVREPIVAVGEPTCENEARKRQIKLAEIKVKIMEAKDTLEECVADQDFNRASELKDKIAELENLRTQLIKDPEEPIIKEVRVEKNDPETLLKCLTMCAEVLKQMSNDKGIGPTMSGLLESLILPGIANTHPAVRNMAVVCLGTCALHSKDLANRHLLLLLQIAQLDDPKIRISALKAVIDQLLLNGMDVLKGKPSSPQSDNSGTGNGISSEDHDSRETAKEAEEENTVNNILSLLSAFLDSEIPELRTETAEGLAKLMFCGRLSSSKLLSRLVLMWYNPVTEDDTRLRHCLGVFFPLYAYASRSNQECFEESFLPTIQTLLNAPASSPLAEVDIANVAELFVDLTRLSGLNHNKKTVYQGLTVHDCLAVRLCNEILKDPRAPEIRLYAKCLSLLELDNEDLESIKDLMLLLEEVLQEVKDKVCIKAIEKVIHQLKRETKSKTSATSNQDAEISTIQGATENAEGGENDGEQLKSAKKAKRDNRLYTTPSQVNMFYVTVNFGTPGQKKVSTTGTSSRRTRKANEASDESDGEELAGVHEVVTRPSRRAKALALEKTKKDLTALMNREANGV
uniref:Non-SMC condensin I complex, subunit G n=1 Tax=Lepisosteus oculatus TaxID=7918 RepID=W5M685_LEPOC